MFKLIRTDARNQDFLALVKGLDLELAITDGEDHAFYHQFNGLENIKYVVVGYEDGIAKACGAIKQFDKESMEIKRMFVRKESRGNGYAMLVLKELQTWSKGLGFQKCILETGKKQPEAINLYQKANFKRIKNYGQYAGIENSLCFGKLLD